jgi:3-oxoacyl-[acyl-carrier-protein] synthase-3
MAGANQAASDKAMLRAFGCYLPSRVVENAELAASVGVDPAWILHASGIEQRRFAAAEETVATLGTRAAEDCLASAGVDAREIGLLLVASGSSERRFPGPASAIGAALGIAGTPAIDLPLASAGSLFGMALAAQLTHAYGNVLVVASEIMSRTIVMDAAGRDTAILFGDGAGACLIGAEAGFARVADSVLCSDGEFAAALTLGCDGPLHMDGRTIILQAARKIPRAILELLERNGRTPSEVTAFLMHQANLNLITRVAQAVDAPPERFFRNLNRYGNTSSASLLIAAAEWWREQNGAMPGAVVFAAFGAGLHWGALLALP